MKYDNINNVKKLRLHIRSKLYLKYFITNVDHIFVISKALKEFFENHLNKYKKSMPVSVLNMKVEPDRYNSHINVTENKDTVFAGTLYGDQNGIYYLLKAFLKIINDFPESRLIIIGDNTKVNRMKKINSIMNQVTNPERIIFTGELTRDNVIKWLNSAYCLVLARPDNIQAQYGFSTKLGEYLCTGEPVVITEVGDIPLFLKNGENAYIAKPSNVDSFAEN